MNLRAGIVAALLLGFFCQPARSESGTVGAGFVQLYDETAPSHRGPLIVALLLPNSPGAQAGVRLGDIVTLVNGEDISGLPLADILEKRIQGPAGESVRFTIIREGTQRLEISVTRRPYAPQSSAASDPFIYTAPGNWRLERADFPLPWAPALKHTGLEQLFFAPDFYNPDSEEYHTFAFFLWMEGKYPESAAALQSELQEYFTGVSKERATDKNFSMDPEQVKVTLEPADAPLNFLAQVKLYDTLGKLITLHAEVSQLFDQSAGHSVLFLCLSPQDRNSAVWKPLRAIRVSFHFRHSG